MAGAVRRRAKWRQAGQVSSASWSLNHAGTRALNLLHPARDLRPSFLREREEDGKSPRTVRLELAAVRLLYRALRWAGATTDDPFSGARPARDATAPWDKRQLYRKGCVALTGSG